MIFAIRAPSRLYLSTDFDKTFQLAKNELAHADIRKDFGILKSPSNNNKLLLVSFDVNVAFRKRTQTTLFITSDGAKSWKKVVIPFQVRDREPIQSHPKQEDWLITQENHFRLRPTSASGWVSTDFGLTWKRIKSNCQMVKWGAYDDKEQQTIFITTSEPSSTMSSSSGSEFTLWRSRDLGKTFQKLVEHVYSFGVQGGFLFVSVELHHQATSRVMHVSTNGGDKFEEADVPAIGTGQFYSIVEMVHGMVFLHVDESGDTGKGTLYTSNADGIVYADSLRNHFYTNGGITNFYRVESMRGVYLTHRLNADRTLASVITLDNGAHWRALYLSKAQCQVENAKATGPCSLQFHGYFSQVKGVQVQPPLSHANVFGLILLHGSASDALTNKTNVYLSHNGGYNWTKIFDGPHHYAIGDHGNIIVVIPRINSTANALHFSFDFGKCWNTMKFTEKSLNVRGIVTEPGAKTRRFSIWGFDASAAASSREWVVVTLNFENAFERECHSGDYIYWPPHAEGKKAGCLLGVKESYPRRISEAKCFSGNDYLPQIRTSKCQCGMADLECDYGYFYQMGACKRMSHVRRLVCINNELDKISDWHGFRRIPGDQCTGETHTAKYIDAHERCEFSGDAIYGIVQPVKKKIKKTAFVMTVILLVVIVIVLSLFLLRRRLKRSSHRPSYKYSELVSQENDGYVAVDGRNGQTLTYHDESDSDAEMLNL